LLSTTDNVSGGWDYETGVISEDMNEQIDQAFANVQHVLKEAGGKGWEQVFKVNSYHIPLDNRAMNAMARNFGKWMHKHKPLWTCVGVAKLRGGDMMRVEIEVQAYDKGA
jgi:enamine deaminase RidA (YjgF/YER057c/UK114 family)